MQVSCTVSFQKGIIMHFSIIHRASLEHFKGKCSGAVAGKYAFFQMFRGLTQVAILRASDG